MAGGRTHPHQVMLAFKPVLMLLPILLLHPRPPSGGIQEPETAGIQGKEPETEENSPGRRGTLLGDRAAAPLWPGRSAFLLCSFPDLSPTASPLSCASFFADDIQKNFHFSSPLGLSSFLAQASPGPDLHISVPGQATLIWLPSAPLA